MVTFFFVLSGFLTQTSAAAGRALTGGQLLTRRLSTLLPLYYFTLLICVGIEVLNLRFPWRTFVLDLLLLQAWFPGYQLAINPPAWFMSALLACVVLCPLVSRGFEGQRARKVFVAVTIGAWLVTQVVLAVLFTAGSPRSEELAPLYFPLSHLCSFLLGMALEDLRRWLQRWEIGDVIAVSAFVCVAGVCALELHTRYAGSAVVPGLSGGSLYAPLFGALVLTTVMLPAGVVQRFDNRLVRFLGVLSFPIYLLQVPAFKVSERVWDTSGVTLSAPQHFVVFSFLLLAGSSVYVLLLDRLVKGMFAASLHRLLRGRHEISRWWLHRTDRLADRSR